MGEIPVEERRIYTQTFSQHPNDSEIQQTILEAKKFHSGTYIKHGLTLGKNENKVKVHCLNVVIHTSKPEYWGKHKLPKNKLNETVQD